MRHRVTIDGVFPLERGGTLSDVTVDVRTWGRHRKNATLICHALTGDADADAWWAGLFGTDRLFDPATGYTVAMNVLGSCVGTTGPTSERPDGEGTYGADFPDVTIRDMVNIQRRVLELLNVQKLDLVIGGSMGGMQVLEWALMYPEMVDTIVPIAVGSAQSAWAVGISDAQRSAITSDPKFRGGHYPADDPPRDGLRTARMFAMITYRAPTEFSSRFGRSLVDGDFAVQSYLRYQGDKLVDRFDANTYLTLIDAMDSHDLGRGRGPIEAILRRIEARTLVVGISSDVLYPVGEVRELAAGIPGARFAVLDSNAGHDGFLVDVEALNRIVLTELRERVTEEVSPGSGAAWA